MNRLTKKETIKDMDNGELPFQQGTPQHIYFTLGKIEDALEKYGIESVEELDNLIVNYRTSPILTEEMIKEIAVKEQRRVMKDLVKEICYHEYGDIFKDRDTWKKACELACGEINCDNCQIQEECEKCGDCIYVLSKYFYQQAQKEKTNV